MPQVPAAVWWVAAAVGGFAVARATAPKAPKMPDIPGAPTPEKDINEKLAQEISGSKIRELKRAYAAREKEQFKSLLNTEAKADESLIKTKSLLGE